MSDFDPDAYLQRKGIKVPPPEAPPDAPRMSDADVDAYLAEMARRRATPQVNPWETYASRGADALPLGRPIVNGLSAAALQGAKALGVGEPGAQLTPEARGKLMAMGELPQETLNTIPGFLGSYRDVRDTRDFRSDVGSEQNPRAAGLGTATGIIATALAPLPKSLGGAGGSTGVQALRAAANGGRGIGAAARTGALAGGLQAAGDSRADLTQPTLGGVLHQALDTGLGTVAGALGGAVGYGMGRAAPSLLRLARRQMSELAASRARRVLLNGADSASGREPLSDDAMLEAIRSGGIVPFGTTRGAAIRLDRAAEQVRATYSATLEELESMGVQGPEARTIADALMLRAAEEQVTTGANKAIPNAFRAEAANIGEVAPQGRLGLQQAEAIKRRLQQEARYGRLEETPVNEARREIASVVRQANEDAVHAAGEAAGSTDVGVLSDAFVPLKQRLGRLIEARDAAERGAAAAGRRATFGLRETIVGSAAGSPAAGLGLALGSSALKNRFPSTIASGAYWSSELARALANGAAVGNARGTLPAAMTRLGLGIGQEVVPETPDSQEEKHLKALAQAEALRKRR